MKRLENKTCGAGVPPVRIETHRQDACATLALLVAVLFCGLLTTTHAQTITRIINGHPVTIHEGPSSPPTPSSGPSHSESSSKGNGPWLPSEPPLTPGDTNDMIQLSFQNANIDMVIQWLAQTTGKTVIKSPRVQAQLTIASPSKVSKREALVLVYRALALDGYSIVESSQSIMIVPKGEEPRMSPGLLPRTEGQIPQGREQLMKIFTLKHAQAEDLKARIQSALSDQGTVEVDSAANELIVADYNDNLRLAGELITALDKEKPEDVAVRVIPLKHMSAQDLAKELGPLYQKMTGKNSGETVDIAADDRSNSLIVFSDQATFDALQNIVSALDTEEAQEKTMRTFVLKNADAQDVAKQLQDLSEGQNNNGSGYPFIIFSPYSRQSNTKGVSVVADRRRNAVIVQAPPAQMDGIAKMINELDAPVPGDSLAPRIFHLKYVSSADIEDVLNELFVKKQQSRDYFDYYYGNNSSSGNTDVGRLYGKIRITSEPYSNTIIVSSNSKESLDVVEHVLDQLDQPSATGESTLQVGLKFAKAADVAKSINILFAKNGSPPLRPVNQPNQPAPQPSQQQQQVTGASESRFNLEQETREEGYYPWLGGQADNYRSSDSRTAQPVSDLVGRVRAVADERSNALLISASVHYFPQILKLLAEMDAPSDQVSIEARIVEVSSDFLDKLGVRWSPNGSEVFTPDDYDNAILAHANAQYQQGFGGLTTVNSPPAPSSSLSQVLTELRSGVLSSSINVDYLIQFLRKTTDATVLGDPQITISDNEMGKLFVGQQVPIPENTLVSSVSGSQTTSFTYKDVGVVLEVTPHINDSGDVQLKVHAEASAVVPGQTILGGVIISTRNFRTDLTARNGETLVLGGIIQQKSSDTLRKTPFLGDIPGLGWAFKKRDKSTEEVELMVFLHPKVTRTPEEANQLLEDVYKRAPLIEKWKNEHGGN